MKCSARGFASICAAGYSYKFGARVGVFSYDTGNVNARKCKWQKFAIHLNSRCNYSRCPSAAEGYCTKTCEDMWKSLFSFFTKVILSHCIALISSKKVVRTDQKETYCMERTASPITVKLSVFVSKATNNRPVTQNRQCFTWKKMQRCQLCIISYEAHWIIDL